MMPDESESLGNTDCAACMGRMTRGLGSHVCAYCKEDVHTFVVCDLVVMPQDGFYFCCPDHLRAHNELPDSVVVPEHYRPGEETFPDALQAAVRARPPPPWESGESAFEAAVPKCPCHPESEEEGQGQGQGG